MRATGLPQSGKTGTCQGILKSQGNTGNVRKNDENVRENVLNNFYSLSRMGLRFRTTNFAWKLFSIMHFEPSVTSSIVREFHQNVSGKSGKSGKCLGNLFSKFCGNPELNCFYEINKIRRRDFETRRWKHEAGHEIRVATVRKNREMSENFQTSGKTGKCQGNYVKSPSLAF